MSREPLVSAIMPTHNTGQFISEAVEGIINQSHTNWELIIVDDGSTDETASLVRQIKDPRIIFMRQDHKGRAAARNMALRQASGDYIAIVDADDISLPTRFELQVDFLERNRDIAVVGGQILHFVDKSHPVRFSRYPTTPDEVREHFRRGVMGVPHPAAMVRREVFQEVGPYCEECLRAQDFELFLRVSHLFQMTNLDSELLLYRNDPRSTSFSSWMELHLYHEYALYRGRCFVSGGVAIPFDRWSQRKEVHLRLATLHTLRYIKSQTSARIRWWWLGRHTRPR